jgi:predicted dehydrogenase
MTIENTSSIDRRGFLKSAAAAASFTVLPAATVASYAQNSKVELGLVGCGGRGKWIGRLFQEMSDFKVVALHDYFHDRLDRAAKELDVAKDRHYLGLDGYKELIAGKVDAVAIESPPYFHPSQAIAAMQAGKHTYIAKPVAVDVPGCVAVLEAARAVKDKSVIIDFQTRNNEFYREAARRVHAGAIGAPVLGQCYYHCERLGKQCEPGTELARLRNWCFDIALSGDIIVEQNIHVIDVANWMINAHPEKAMGACGRKGRVDVGDCNDHFSVTFLYPDNVMVDFSSAQFIKGYSADLCMRLYGAEGTLDTHYGGMVCIDGDSKWPGGKTNTIYQDGAVNNIRDFHASIVEGKPINIVEDGVMSALTAILGRKAAYEQRMVTWEEMMADTTALDAKLNLPADGPEQKC